jgi:hypothetical protein
MTTAVCPVDLARVLLVLKQQHRALQVAYPHLTYVCDAGACPVCTLIAHLTEETLQCTR